MNEDEIGRTAHGVIYNVMVGAEAEISLKHEIEARGEAALRTFKREYEQGGAPYGLSMAGLKEWLIEQGHEDLVQSWEFDEQERL